MFDELRRKITRHNTVLFSVLLSCLLAVACAFFVLRVGIVVNEGLQRSDSMLQISENKSAKSSRKVTNCLIIIYNFDDEEKPVQYVSDDAMYDTDFLLRLTDYIVLDADEVGRLKIDNKYVAFRKSIIPIPGRYLKIALYDYTELMESTISLIVSLFVLLVVSIVILYFIFRYYAIKTVEPIESAFVKQRELVANASHELKTPLTIISASLSVIGDSDEENRKKWLDGIGVQTNRMTGLVNEMLSLARIEQSEEHHLSKVNFSECLTGVILTTEAALFENKNELIEEVSDGISINADRGDLEKLLYSLFENAIKYTPSGGKIWVKLRAERKKAVFVIQNEGEGIPKDKLPKIFDRFYKVDESHSGGDTPSYGLGLAIVKSTVDSFGGAITAESEEGKYTRFTLTFKLR